MPPVKRQKVLLADDHLYVAEALRLHLEEKAADRFEVVALALDGVQALADARKHKPQIVVMDIQMPRMDGLAALREMKKLSPPPTVLILSGYDDQAHLLEALRAGADEYLFKKDMTPALLTAHLDHAAAKVLTGQNPAAGVLLEAARATPGLPRLTATELEILSLAAHQGATAKEVSKKRLSGGKTSVRTVATHWQNIYEKLGTRTQAQAVCMAIKLGLISAEPVEKNTNAL